MKRLLLFLLLPAAWTINAQPVVRSPWTTAAIPNNAMANNVTFTGTFTETGSTNFFGTNVSIQNGYISFGSASRVIIGSGLTYQTAKNNAFDSEDTIIGFNSMGSLPGGVNSFITAVGADTGGNIVSGAGDSMLGQKSMANATNAQSSTAIGAKSFGNCLYLLNDTALGYASEQFSLGGGPGGGLRTAIGYNAGQYDDGTKNVWIGANSGPQGGTHGTGSDNLGLGYNSLSALTTSVQNTCLGDSSGQSLQGGGNAVFVGFQAGQVMTSCNNVTFLGAQASQNWANTTGTILIGASAGQSTASANNIGIIGHDGGQNSISDLYFNEKTSTTASTWPITLHAAGGSGANVAGASLTLAWGQSTGNAVGGTLNLAVPVTAASGSSQNALTNAVTINSSLLTLNPGFALATTSNNLAAPVAITVTASPFNYTNLDGYSEFVFVNGGTGTAIAINGTTIYTTLGDVLVPLQPNEWLTSTYTVAPTMRKKPY